MRRRVHLLSNSHIDPVWRWDWQEGVGFALSTYRTAADLCEEFDEFIFNHNEALLYMWAEEHEPELFERIKKLVKQGKWAIMGGWYLQPDCNMPSGESLVRQILVGKRYFAEKFGVEPRVAMNLDSFGTTRGLVQILAKSGYDGYLACRPGDVPVPADRFRWIGFDGSEIIGYRAGAMGSGLGHAKGKVEGDLGQGGDLPILAGWGIGDHGGGPSRQDLAALRELIAERKDFDIFHSTLDSYFDELNQRRNELPEYDGDLNPWGVGCYTSQIRIKQKHRQLENELFMAEKMACAAAFQGLMAYPRAELAAAQLDLLFSEFHDALPGTSVQPVEDDVLGRLDHGLKEAERAKTRAFFALAAGQPTPKEDEMSILVYNPHPFPLDTVVECDFSLPEGMRPVGEEFMETPVYHNGKLIPYQSEKPFCNVREEWRKRVVVRTTLDPSAMNRFDCAFKMHPRRPEFGLKQIRDRIVFKTDEVEIVINAKTGLIDRYCVGGVDYVGERAFEPLVIADDADPWGMHTRSYRKVMGRFELMSPEEGMRFSGVVKPLLSVRIIDDGMVRSVVEAVFGYGHSAICQRYILPRIGSEIEVQTRVFWNEKDRMLKLSIPYPSVAERPVPSIGKPAAESPQPDPSVAERSAAAEGLRYIGQVAYGVQDLYTNGDECVAQKWTAVVSPEHALTIINDGTHGSDFSEDGLRLTLLRSPAHAGHPFIGDLIVWQDRFTPRIDQGERFFRFWINGGPAAERLEKIDREALARNERPFACQIYPSAAGQKPLPLAVLEGDDAVQMTTAKMSEDGNDLIIRLFEPTGMKREVTLSLPFCGMRENVMLEAFEIKTLRVDVKAKKVVEADLLERVRPV